MSVIRAGYTQTDVGVIPEDWHLTKLESLSAFITKGSTPTTYGFKWESSGVLFLRSECVAEEGLDLTQSMFISSAAHSTLRRSEVRDGDILVTITGNVGRVVRLAGISEANLNQHIARVRITAADADGQYVYHFLAQPETRRRFNSITTGQAYPQISLKQVREAVIPLPPAAEQSAIAEALSDVDALIESLEQLLAKKRHLKQATTQELLTGKKRLPGFSGDWEVKRLGEVADVDSDNLNSATPAEFAFKYISLEDVDSGSLRSYSEQLFHSAPSRARRRIRAGDILVSTVRPNLQSHLLFDSLENDWVCSTGFSVVRCKANDAVPAYIFSHLFGHLVTKQIETLLTGSNYPAINGRDVRALEIPMPCITEQTAIAVTLSDMDAELANLEAQLAKTRALKQGMMQKLLTGEIRLI